MFISRVINLGIDFMCVVGILSENMLLYCVNLSRAILIPRRSSGRGFHPRDRRLPRPISQRSSGGKITAPWCLGITYLFTKVLDYVFQFRFLSPHFVVLLVGSLYG